MHRLCLLTMTDLQTIASQLHALASSIDDHVGTGTATAASYAIQGAYAKNGVVDNGKRNYNIGPYEENWSIPFGGPWGSSPVFNY